MKQNSTATNIAQIAALMAIAAVAFLGLMADPTDDNPMWFLTFIATKAIAVAEAYAVYKLEARWRPGNKWLTAYDKSCNEALEAPNPMYIGEEDEEE